MLNNKYKKIYLRLINKCRKLNRPIGNYTGYEDHHILPKSIYPQYKDDKWNIVPLTPREHFIAHLLLTKMFTGKNRTLMVYAFNFMKTRVINNITSRLYETLRQDMINVPLAAKSYEVYDPNGKLIRIHNLAEFCRQQGWKSSTGLHNVCRGKQLSYKGYTLHYHNIDEKYKDSLERMRQSKIKTFYYIDPSDRIITINNLSEYCELNGLSYQCMLHVSNDRIKKHKGYRKFNINM